MKVLKDHRTPIIRVELLYPKDGYGSYLLNGGTYLPNCTASQATILQYEFLSLQQYRILHAVRGYKSLGSRMRFGIRTEVPMNIEAFWDMTPCSMAETSTFWKKVLPLSSSENLSYGNKFLIFRHALDISYINWRCYVVWFQAKTAEVPDFYMSFTCSNLNMLTTSRSHSRRWASVYT
jgi:hypothetical protein